MVVERQRAILTMVRTVLHVGRKMLLHFSHITEQPVTLILLFKKYQSFAFSEALSWCFTLFSDKDSWLIYDRSVNLLSVASCS